MSLRTRLWCITVAGVVFAGAAVVLLLSNDENPLWTLVAPFAMLSFIGVGVYAWWRRPHNGFGALMTAVGFVYVLGAPQLSADPLTFSVGLLFGSVFIGTVIHMLLAFPSGRLETRQERVFVFAIYTLLLIANVALVLVDGDCHCGDVPDNVLAIWHKPGVGEVILSAAEAIALAMSLWLLSILVRRWRAATAPQRRSLGPVLWTGTVFIDGLALSLFLELVGVSHGIAEIPDVVGLLAFAALPYAFLVSLGRSRWFRAGAVGSLIERLNDPERRGGVRDALAEGLGDRSLRLIYWVRKDERYVDFAGHAVELPLHDPLRAVTEVERDGRRIGALVHDAALLDDPELVRAAGAAAALALENERLEAELRARVDELQVSRAKVIEFGLAERRRLERDLHDGAQQRLVALSLQVGMARAKLESDPEGAGQILDGAREELRLAQEELRELARGIHPAILTDRGLDAAVESLAQRATLPVDVLGMPAERLPAPVEAAAYFVVAESLTNVAKYAHAGSATVSVVRENGHALVEVRDDGVGGADPGNGTGLRGLADRLAALDGRLEVQSPSGAGTIVRAKIPCA